jgi:hypothetical protein
MHANIQLYLFGVESLFPLSASGLSLSWEIIIYIGNYCLHSKVSVPLYILGKGPKRELLRKCVCVRERERERERDT